MSIQSSSPGKQLVREVSSNQFYNLKTANMNTMVGLFSKERSFCTICKKGVSHKNKPKPEWNVDGPLCGNCYVDLMKKNFKKNNDDKCALCGIEPGSFNLWKPKKEWEIHGWLCKPCFDEKERSDDKLRENCTICGAKLGFFCYAFKTDSGKKGQICKNCKNSRK